MATPIGSKVVDAPELIDEPRARLDRLAGYLQADPDNLQLIADTAEAALAVGALETVNQLIKTYERIEPLPPRLLNLDGLAALSEGRLEEAARAFSRLREYTGVDPHVAFNLAWTRMMLLDPQGALDLMEEPVSAAVPAAAALKVRTLHHLARLEDALAFGQAWATRTPENRELLSALSIVAMDADRTDLAILYAEQAGDRPDALATLGMLSLGHEQVGRAADSFDKALALAPDNARALLGKGLELLVEGRIQAATDRIDQAADLFVSHIGSWLASGWAHIIAGDHNAARARFERALALDDRFAETQGALAVLDIVEGRLAEGERRTEVALRLDRSCLSANLAKILILGAKGQKDAAQRILQGALNRPLDENGKTLAQTLVRLGLSTPSQGGA